LFENRQKRGRLAEAEISQKDRVVDQQEKIISFYKNLASGVALALLLLLNFLAYKNSWATAPKIERGLGIVADVLLLYFIGRIKWQMDKTWTILLGVLAILGFILAVIFLP
jgi:glucan phosphoethanolaminetransferase (alkaline phosphatase superfamily)